MSATHPILADMTESCAQPRDATVQQLDELREYFNGDLFAFAWTFFGFKDLEGSGYRPVHREVCDLLAAWGTDAPDGPGNRLMIQIPRGSYKTSLCTLSNAIWQVCRNPNETVLICNEIVDNAKKWLRAIREMVQRNKLFQAVYADLIPPGISFADQEKGKSMPRTWKWNDFELTFERDKLVTENSLTAAGVGTATTGGHWTRIIKDDLVSEDAKNSPAVMQRVCEWFDSSLPLEQPPYKGKDLIVCTPWTFADVYRYVLEKYEYQLYRRSVLETHPETGEMYSLLPKKWTVEELLKERERDPYYFSAQMMCHPQAGRDKSFDPEWLRYGRTAPGGDGELQFIIDGGSYAPAISQALDEAGRPLPAPDRVPLWHCSKALLVDPAAAETQQKVRQLARTAMVAVAMDPWGRTFILDCWAGRGSPPEVLAQIFRLTAKWDIQKVGIEEVTFSLIFRHWLLQECRRRDVHLTVKPLKPGGRRKDDRIEEKQHGFQAGFYYLNQLPSLEAFKVEYMDYPYAQTRDLLDALAYDAEVLVRPETPEEQTAWRAIEAERQLMGGRDPVTGY